MNSKNNSNHTIQQTINSQQSSNLPELKKNELKINKWSEELKEKKA